VASMILSPSFGIIRSTMAILFTLIYVEMFSNKIPVASTDTAMNFRADVSINPRE